jgi:hypothetical protein
MAPNAVNLFWVPRPRLGVGVSSNVKRIRTPTQSRGRGTPTRICRLFSQKKVKGVEWHPARPRATPVEFRRQTIHLQMPPPGPTQRLL